MADGEIDVCLFNGGVRTSEQEYMAQLLRRKSKVLVAFGSCASEGCIPGLANLHNRQEIFDNSYRDTPSTDNPSGVRPQAVTKVAEGNLHLPVFYDTLKTLDQTVKVDYYLPGCPPESDRIWDAIEAIVTGQASAGRFRDRCDHDRVRFLSSHADGKEDQGIQADVGGDSRSGHLPAGAGHYLLRDRHPGRLWLSLPAGQFALHRLLRSQRRRGGFWRAVDERAGLGDRFPGSPGD